MLKLTGRHQSYTQADTWYLSWASDGHCYSPWTDGVVNDKKVDSGLADLACTGRARVIGDDPSQLVVESLAAVQASAVPYGGRYPCASLHLNGVWYVGTYCLTNIQGENGPWVHHEGKHYNWGQLGPFIGWHWSTDDGVTWHDPPTTPEQALFGETHGELIRIGAPHVVDHGCNQMHRPNDWIYLVAHGVDPKRPPERWAGNSWITGDQVYLLRVMPGVEYINDVNRYEFFAGHDSKGSPRWSSNIEDMRPILDQPGICGHATATWFPKRQCYLMCVTDGWPTSETMTTRIYQSPKLTGPWQEMTCWKDFGPQAYFVNIPSRFINEDEDRFWISSSANFTNDTQAFESVSYESSPPGMGYGLCLHEIEWTD